MIIDEKTRYQWRAIALGLLFFALILVVVRDIHRSATTPTLDPTGQTTAPSSN